MQRKQTVTKPWLRLDNHYPDLKLCAPVSRVIIPVWYIVWTGPDTLLPSYQPPGLKSEANRVEASPSPHRLPKVKNFRCLQPSALVDCHWLVPPRLVPITSLSKLTAVLITVINYTDWKLIANLMFSSFWQCSLQCIPCFCIHVPGWHPSILIFYLQLLTN